MGRIRSDTTPEKRVRSLLRRLGFRFRVHGKLAVGHEKRMRRCCGQQTVSLRGSVAFKWTSDRTKNLAQRGCRILRPGRPGFRLEMRAESALAWPR